MENIAQSMEFNKPCNYEEWVKSLKLDMDNELTEEEYLKKRDATKSHKTEQSLFRAIHNLTKSSVLNSLIRAIEAVDVMQAIALNEIKISNPIKYAEITASGGKNG